MHYHMYIPKSYDGSSPYALYITLPGYGAYYFQGVAVNLKTEHFATEAKKYREEMIIVAPQPNDWGETSKRQIIALTEYMLAAYNIDTNKVYISGYSGGGLFAEDDAVMGWLFQKESKTAGGENSKVYTGSSTVGT